MSSGFKGIGLMALLILLSGCTERQFVQGVEVACNESAQFIGLKNRPNTMQVPNYYSTQPILTKYELGMVYEIEHLDCEAQSNRCGK